MYSFIQTLSWYRSEDNILHVWGHFVTDWFAVSSPKKRNVFPLLSKRDALFYYNIAEYCDLSYNRFSSHTSTMSWQSLSLSLFVNLFCHFADIRLSEYDKFLSLLYPFQDVKVCQLIFILFFFQSHFDYLHLPTVSAPSLWDRRNIKRGYCVPAFSAASVQH